MLALQSGVEVGRGNGSGAIAVLGLDGLSVARDLGGGNAFAAVETGGITAEFDIVVVVVQFLSDVLGFLLVLAAKSGPLRWTLASVPGVVLARSSVGAEEDVLDVVSHVGVVAENCRLVFARFSSIVIGVGVGEGAVAMVLDGFGPVL